MPHHRKTSCLPALSVHRFAAFMPTVRSRFKNDLSPISTNSQAQVHILKPMGKTRIHPLAGAQ